MKQYEEKLSKEELIKKFDSMGDFFHHEHFYLKKYQLELYENYKPKKDLHEEEGIEVNRWISRSFNFGGLICFEPGQIIKIKKMSKKKAILLVRFKRYSDPSEEGGHPDSDTDWECTLNINDYEGGFYHQPKKEGLWRIAVPKTAEEEE